MAVCKTRFAPSPTGALHLGNARTALFSWAFARHHGGQCFLRYEDTDTERSQDVYKQRIDEALQWLGLSFDGPVWVQSQRSSRYDEVKTRLLEQGHLYVCCCSKERLDALKEQQRAAGETPRYDGRCRDAGIPYDPTASQVLRLRMPDDGTCHWHDDVYGDVVFAFKDLGDWVAFRSDGTPTYNFTVVVDDADMGVTHIIRGEDHLSNTPKQMMLYQAIGAQHPTFVHVPMILGGDGKRLSKRHGALDLLSYRDRGVLPEAMMSYLIRLGWAWGDQELFTQAEIVEHFESSRIRPSAAIFDHQKLLWVNQQVIKAMPLETLLQRLCVPAALSEHPAWPSWVAYEQGRVKTLEQCVEEGGFLLRADLSDELKTVYLQDETRALLGAFTDVLAPQTDWSPQALEATVKGFVVSAKIKMPQLGKPLRVVLTGREQAPGIALIMSWLGRQEVLARLQQVC